MNRTTILQGIRLMRFSEYYDQIKHRSLTQADAADLLGMSDRTFRSDRSHVIDRIDDPESGLPQRTRPCQSSIVSFSGHSAWKEAVGGSAGIEKVGKKMLKDTLAPVAIGVANQISRDIRQYGY